MKTILILVVFLHGCELFQDRAAKEISARADCNLTLPDGTALHCGIKGGRNVETQTPNRNILK